MKISPFPSPLKLFAKDVHFCDLKTKEEKGQSSITKNQMFRDLVKKANENQVLFDYVLADIPREIEESANRRRRLLRFFD